MARHLLLRPATRHAGARGFHSDPFPVGSVVEVRTDVVTVSPSLPLHQPRVRAGVHVRILSAMDDPSELVMFYRFEVLDARGRGSGWWAFCEVDNLAALDRRPRAPGPLSRLRAAVGR